MITHIVLATISIIYSSYVAIFPTKIKLRNTYLLALGTIVSGSMVTIIAPLHLGKACIEGAFYIGFMIAISVITEKDLLTELMVANKSRLCKRNMKLGNIDSQKYGIIRNQQFTFVYTVS